MPKYNKDKYNGTYTLKKVALVITFTLIATILMMLVFMVLDTNDKNNQNGLNARQFNSNDDDITSEIPTYTQTPIINTPTIQPTEVPVTISQLPHGEPSEYSFNIEKLNELDLYIQGQIDNGFPGAVLMVAKDGHIIFHNSYGYSKKYDGMNLLSNFENMDLDTMFDLASLSKVYATTFSIMKLVDEGKITLDGKVANYLSEYEGTDKEMVTISMLLSHNSGYTEGYKFYGDESHYSTDDRDTVYSYAKQIELDDTPGTVYDYNDLNFVILGMIVEEVSGMRIDEYARINIYEPLGIETQVTYRPLDNGKDRLNIAATERLGNTRDGSIYFDGIRQYTIQGEVHDENAYYSMDQVSGHAGLFATSYGLTVLNQVLLNGGQYDGVRIFKQQTVDNWLRTINDKYYQLGLWNAKEYSNLKSYVSDFAFYHNGWTGTATIIDKENNLSIILLTNKRHTPCPDGDFEGTKYEISYYMPVIQKVYSALIN